MADKKDDPTLWSKLNVGIDLSMQRDRFIADSKAWMDQQILGRYIVAPTAKPPVSPTGGITNDDVRAIEEMVQRMVRRSQDDIMLNLRLQNDRLMQEINALKKTLASLPQGGPRALTPKEKIDYTKVVSEDEDLPEEGYRGWPMTKEDKIF